jgi:AcrR family transcriptional regulator
MDVAITVFARHGFHGCSMNDVADAAGVTKPVLYQHWASKRDLYLAVLEEAGHRLVDTIAKATAPALSGQEKVRSGFAAYFQLIADDPATFQVLFGGGARRDPEFSGAVRDVGEAITAAIAPLIKADIDPEHQALLAHGIVGMAETIGRRLLASGVPFDPERVGRQVTDLAWAGLRGVHRV